MEPYCVPLDTSQSICS